MTKCVAKGRRSGQHCHLAPKNIHHKLDRNRNFIKC